MEAKSDFRDAESVNTHGLLLFCFVAEKLGIGLFEQHDLQIVLQIHDS